MNDGVSPHLIGINRPWETGGGFFASYIYFLVMIMPKLDELKTRIDWLKELFKILAAMLVADVAGLAKLSSEPPIGIW